MFKEEKSEIEMSKELIELNSIEIIKNMFIDYDKNFEYYGDFPTLNLERKKAIETILNLIENQKAEIEKKDLEIVSLEKTHNYDVKMIDEVKGEAVKLYKEIEKKEKIIDLMAEQLANYKHEEIICMEVDCKHIELQNEGKCIGDKECIKQYFEKKAEEE